MNTIKYIEKVEKVTNVNSINGLSKLLGISRQAVQQYKKGTSSMDSDVILTVSKILKIPVFKILCDIKADKASSPEAKKEWNTLSKKVSNSPTLYIMLSRIVYLLFMPSPLFIDSYQ